MTERPILFSAPMVRALLAGTKTQTRRIVKPGNLGPGGLPVRQPTPNWNAAHYGGGMWSDGLDFAAFCPYGVPGDRLWVREAWFFEGTDMMRLGRTHSQQDGVVRYIADGARRTITTDWQNVEKWMTRKPINRPGIHMPRWASRITLEVTGVRVEGLQDISEADAVAEGVHADQRCRQDDDTAAFNRIGPVRDNSFPIARYAALWESINGPGSWDANPWVWVVEFRRLT